MFPKIFVALIALLLLCSVAVCEQKAGAPGSQRQVRSLIQACRNEVRALCPGSMRQLNKCMQEKVKDISDDTCRKWVLATSTCDNAATATLKCTKEETKRSCLRKLAKEDLPTECTSTEYYQSIARTARRFPNKAAANPAKPQDSA